MQPEFTNANPYFLGGFKVSTTTGQRMPAPNSTTEFPPHVIDGFEDGKMSADEWYVVGTSGEKVRVMLITYA